MDVWVGVTHASVCMRVCKNEQYRNELNVIQSGLDG